MIDFEKLSAELPKLRLQFQSNEPFAHLAIDNFCFPERLNELVEKIPDPIEQNIAQSRDYVFAKNKFEKSKFRGIDPIFDEIYLDLMSDQFKNFLCAVTGEAVFVDAEFHGGGLHQGGPGSFLDMHADFNYHPLHKDWFRNLNILLYLNRDWKEEYKGQLKLRHLEHPEKGTKLVEPIFNRCVIMPTRDFTVHGYDKIAFPQGMYRRSLATYAYTLMDAPVEADARSTKWYPEEAGFLKRTVGKHWPALVKIKGKLLGSATAKQQQK